MRAKSLTLRRETAGTQCLSPSLIKLQKCQHTTKKTYHIIPPKLFYTSAVQQRRCFERRQHARKVQTGVQNIWDGNTRTDEQTQYATPSEGLKGFLTVDPWNVRITGLLSDQTRSKGHEHFVNSGCPQRTSVSPYPFVRAHKCCDVIRT